MVCITFDPRLATLIETSARWADAAAGIDQRTVGKQGVMSIPRCAIILQLSQPKIQIDQVMCRTAAQPRRRCQFAVKRITNRVPALGTEHTVAILLLVGADG